MSTHDSSTTVFEKVVAKKWTFLVAFTLAYFLTLVVLGIFNLTPWSSTQTADTLPEQGGQVALPEGGGEMPLRVEIPKLGIRTLVTNPASSDVATLDSALLKGAVRYPGSAVPGEEGNVLLFGHSSRLPVVQNQAFKAFNDIQKLEEGDPIVVFGEERAYIYAVETVVEANTASDAVPLAVDGAKLTLATCNNFGTKEDRFIVTAKLVKIDILEASGE